MSEMNAAAGSRSVLRPKLPTSSARRCVSGATSAVPPENTSATSKSFQTHKNWTMPVDARAGSDSGMMMRKKICVWFAPSTRAASIISPGISLMKLCSKKMHSGRPKIVCAIHTAGNEPLICRTSLKICSRGMSAICSGTICSAKINTKIAPDPRNLIHAKAYAAIVAMMIGNDAAGIAITSEFTK